MSTTVSYKGDTVTSVNNQTKTLETAGKYLEADIILTDVTSGGGSLQAQSKTYTPTKSVQTESVTADSGYDGLSEVDVTVNPIPAEYIIPSGRTLITENGTWDVSDFADAVVNVTGGGGLKYETGEWSPSEDIARGTVSFSDVHTNPPIAIFLSDTTGTAYSTTNSNHLFCWIDPDGWKGKGYPYSSSGYRYAAAYYSYRGSSTSSISSGGYLCSQRSSSASSSGASYPKYWATKSEFHPYSNSTSRYWRAGRTFSWIAIWKP